MVFIPPIAEVGMDIYVLGHHTPIAKDGAKLFEEAWAKAAMLWASRINEDAAIEKMEISKVDSEDALFFESPTPESADMIWKQWSVVRNGWSLLIVSVIDRDNEAVLLPQVKAMVESVRIGEVVESEANQEVAVQPAASVDSKSEDK